jgi:hypothetical protein
MNANLKVKPMIRSYVAFFSVLCALAVTPAAAADLSYGPHHIPAPPVIQPFYLVDQGPQLSGPGIMIVHIGLKWTGVRRPYPFIRPYDDLTRVVEWSDHSGVMTATYEPVVYTGARVRGRQVVGAKVPYRKRSKVYRAK